MDSDIWLYVIVVGTVISATLFLLYVITRTRKKKEKPLETVEREKRPPFKTFHSVTLEEARKAQDEVRTMDLEREILSYAIRRLYEAQAEGKITEEERDRLASEYKEKMMKIKTSISRSESIIALHELESMQDDLINLFNERFDELNQKIDDLRTRVEIEPIKETPILPITVAEEERPTPTKKERAKPHERPAPAKTEAEKRIEKIREEIEKVLERLGQIETEA